MFFYGNISLMQYLYYFFSSRTSRNVYSASWIKRNGILWTFELLWLLIHKKLRLFCQLNCWKSIDQTFLSSFVYPRVGSVLNSEWFQPFALWFWTLYRIGKRLYSCSWYISFYMPFYFMTYFPGSIFYV